MDTITQGLLGAAVGQAGFADRLGRRAVWFGAACGLMPDFDVVMRAAGEWASLVHHRGVTHSVLVLPVASLVIGAVASRILGGGRERFAWIHLTFWALVTHPLLDVFTTYGTQLFAPFSDSRWAFDGVAIVDPIYTLPLAWAVWKKRALTARVALAWGLVYLLLGTAISAHVRTEARARLEAAGFQPVAVRALVPILFPMLRRVVARDADGNVAVGAWSWKGGVSDLLPIDRLDDPAVRAAEDSEEGRIFKWFADDYVSARVERADQTVVYLYDKRYAAFSDPYGALFAARFVIEEGRVVEAHRTRARADFGAELDTCLDLAF